MSGDCEDEFVELCFDLRLFMATLLCQRNKCFWVRNQFWALTYASKSSSRVWIPYFVALKIFDKHFINLCSSFINSWNKFLWIELCGCVHRNALNASKIVFLKTPRQHKNIALLGPSLWLHKLQSAGCCSAFSHCSNSSPSAALLFRCITSRYSLFPVHRFLALFCCIAFLRDSFDSLAKQNERIYLLIKDCWYRGVFAAKHHGREAFLFSNNFIMKNLHYDCKSLAEKNPWSILFKRLTAKKKLNTTKICASTLEVFKTTRT